MSVVLVVVIAWCLLAAFIGLWLKSSSGPAVEDAPPVRTRGKIISVWDSKRQVWTPVGSLSSTDYPNKAA